jgi:uncharacterized membrane protein YgdD (TMEM256/DUF423 family)
MKWFFLFAVFSAVMALMMDAFIAHGLKGFLAERYEDTIFHALSTAARYQLSMAIMMFVLAAYYQGRPSIWLLASSGSICLGTIFFCFTIYVKYLLPVPIFGGLAPLGGMLFMLSFLALIPAIII